MEVTREDVLRCAELAHLQLQEDEVAALQKDMTRLLAHAERLQNINLDEVPPMRHGLAHDLPWQTDSVEQGLTQQEALSNAPSHREGFFTVPKVL